MSRMILSYLAQSKKQKHNKRPRIGGNLGPMRYGGCLKRSTQPPIIPHEKNLYSNLHPLLPSPANISINNLLRSILLSLKLFITLKAQTSICRTIRSPVPYNNNHLGSIVDTLPARLPFEFCHIAINQAILTNVEAVPSTYHPHFAIITSLS